MKSGVRAALGAILIMAIGAGADAADPPVGARLEWRPGVITASVIHDATADYENVTVLHAFDAQGASTTTRWTIPDPAAPGGRREQSANVRTRGEDLESARRVLLVWMPGDPETLPGATAGTVSRALLRELRSTGRAAVVLGAARNDGGNAPLAWLTAGRKYYRGTLTRVEAGTVSLPMLVDGVRTTLPALHARGRVSVGTDTGDAEIWVLDDDRRPLLLRWRALGAESQIVRIDQPPRLPPREGRVGAIELPGALASDRCRGELHGVYFDSGSARLLPESAPALDALAAVLRDHPQWTLTIDGHTDGLGSAESNLALSRARAQSVRDALVQARHVDAARLRTAGYGETRPVESNDTVEGRARNRRVEVSRPCP